MTDRVQVVALGCSVLLLLLVLELVRRRRLSEEYSALWIVLAVCLIGLSLRRDVLDSAAKWLGVYYPPAVLVLMLVAIISVAACMFIRVRDAASVIARISGKISLRPSRSPAR